MNTPALVRSKAEPLSRLTLFAALFLLLMCAITAYIFESNGEHIPAVGPLFAQTAFPMAIACAYAAGFCLAAQARHWFKATFLAWSTLVFVGVQAMFAGLLNFLH